MAALVAAIHALRCRMTSWMAGLRRPSTRARAGH